MSAYFNNENFDPSNISYYENTAALQDANQIPANYYDQTTNSNFDVPLAYFNIDWSQNFDNFDPNGSTGDFLSPPIEPHDFGAAAYNNYYTEGNAWDAILIPEINPNDENSVQRYHPYLNMTENQNLSQPELGHAEISKKVVPGKISPSYSDVSSSTASTSSANEDGRILRSLENSDSDHSASAASTSSLINKEIKNARPSQRPRQELIEQSRPMLQKLGLQENEVEYVNGGYGIKNPLALFPDLRRKSETNVTKNATKHDCNQCKKTFALDRQLRRHITHTHTKEKKYLCIFCGKGFDGTFDLKRHTRTHTVKFSIHLQRTKLTTFVFAGIRPFKCDLCEKSFVQRCVLENHYLTIHAMDLQRVIKERTKIYSCEECAYSSSDAKEYFEHLKQSHPDNLELWKICDRRHFKFSDKQYVNKLLLKGLNSPSN